ncbi:antibiotic biosynthesis monooxygenase [Martelella alba]|uniref:Antibiotic biosynthesis monooxygenase n=1 Tax=Martelella alba TaxID=2590451 RepID=A0A506UI58_9HYPH|nr:antibiotic biosynthesis monooxygenase [Martelella alba]TPW32996.1 antibiotic biosynthesis monooxygenase [Martelella alba]
MPNAFPAPPYYIVAFSSQRREADHLAYDAMSDKMVELAQEQPGFIGFDSARGNDGFGITNSYWENEEAIRAWKRNVDHLAAQHLGRENWYEAYDVRIGRIDRAYGFGRK